MTRLMRSPVRPEPHRQERDDCYQSLPIRELVERWERETAFTAPPVGPPLKTEQLMALWQRFGEVPHRPVHWGLHADFALPRHVTRRLERGEHVLVSPKVLKNARKRGRRRARRSPAIPEPHPNQERPTLRHEQPASRAATEGAR